MASKWKKVKMALGSNLCVYVPTPDEDVSPPQSERCSDVALLSPATDQWTRGGSASLPWSSALRLSRSFNRSSKKCTICLASMKRGEGQAIFTAECSHSFHFQCIASNVKHGNQICPVCRAKWKQVPLQLDPSLGRTRINSGNWSQDNPVMTVIRQFPSRQNSNRRVSAPVFPPNEPAIFNDDEPLDVQTSNSNTSDGSSFERVMIKTYTEVPGVARLTAVDDFTVLIHLKAPVSNSGPTVSQANRIPRAPVDLVTVLDISGSMAGTKLALLKRAMGFVIQNLGPADRLAVIAFSSTARRLFSLRKMSDMGKQHALQAVNSLVANGGTNIAEGLRKGGKVMEDRREKNPVSSVILLSDGQDTYTVTSGPNPGGGQNRSNYQLLLPQSIHGGEGGSGIKIPVHAFGFGSDHDASSMHSISEISGGTFSFIETESVIQDAFAQCIGGLLSVVVKGLQVIVESSNPNVRLRSLKAGSYKNHLMPDRKSGCIDVGDLYADEERDFLVSVNIPTESVSHKETSLLKVNCYYNDPLTKETVKLVSEEITIKRPQNVGKETVISIEVDRQRNRLQSAEAMMEAKTVAEEGDLARAVLILEKFRKVLSETISAKSGDRLCMALDAELKEMQERMASRHVYEASGRAYILSGLSSHSWQRATARGDSTEGSSLVQSYQTPSMTEMLSRSQAQLIIPASQPRPR
ncbi:probable E3 ubiquitin-protein ligase EDA40 isoform X1 [Cynara cardunculus var. scolymus]|uniref:von Willebrand factor, type A n=1 Tax=Cynara cardunculus var. scolymus TaxID=59895 RepID=A0A118K438_CYNCS|nr:probable E3 ubiquitin-protein ligase EDA40 isoform X1 [Cynara cardunculus var. scolymus]KVI06872.1 von Willebrand factor, type A [Cynara cardunculus var. scolymus]